MNPQILSTTSSIPVVFLASLLIWLMFAGLIILWLVDGRIEKEQSLHALLSALVAWGLTELIKNLIPALRPYQFDGKPPLTLTIPTDPAFPSGHSAAAFGLAIALWLHNKKLGMFYILLAALVGTGRILGNVHSYLDVIGGATLGFFSALVLDKLHVTKLLKK